jgi:hypothetical protein
MSIFCVIPPLKFGLNSFSILKINYFVLFFVFRFWSQSCLLCLLIISGQGGAQDKPVSVCNITSPKVDRGERTSVSCSYLPLQHGGDIFIYKYNSTHNQSIVVQCRCHLDSGTLILTEACRVPDRNEASRFRIQGDSVCTTEHLQVDILNSSEHDSGKYECYVINSHPVTSKLCPLDVSPCTKGKHIMLFLQLV